MRAWHLFGLLLVALATAHSAQAESVKLTEPVKVDDCYKAKLEMNLSGKILVKRDDKEVPIELTAKAEHTFTEKVLRLNGATLPNKMARVYEKAKASINVGRTGSDRTLRPERSLCVAQQTKDGFVFYSPKGPLTKEELEVAGEHFDTLSIPGIVPNKEIAVGTDWELANLAVQGLCHFEALEKHDLKGKLVSVENGKAQLSLTGTAVGIEGGAQVKVTVTATCTYDVANQVLTQIRWQQKDERAEAPRSPASVLESTVTILREKIDEPTHLSEQALVSIPDEDPPTSMLHVHLVDLKNRFDLHHERDWQLVALSEKHIVLRLIERGDFVAQVTLTPWKSAGEGKHLSELECKTLIENSTPGWEIEKILQQGEIPSTESGRWQYRISAVGKLDGNPAIQTLFTIANKKGEQIVVMFEMNEKQVEKFRNRDEILVGSIDLK